MKKSMMFMISLLLILCILTPSMEVQAAQKYKTAQTVWDYLDEQGYNDYVKAGIIGNMMAECGGQTLALNAGCKSSAHYGLCQWSRKYCPNMYGASLKSQLKYLNKTMPDAFKYYGKRYKGGFNFKKFKNLKDEKQAARAFSLCYERPASKNTKKREANATKALKYFRSKK